MRGSVLLIAACGTVAGERISSTGPPCATFSVETDGYDTARAAEQAQLAQLRAKQLPDAAPDGYPAQDAANAAIVEALKLESEAMGMAQREAEQGPGAHGDGRTAQEAADAALLEQMRLESIAAHDAVAHNHDSIDSAGGKRQRRQQPRAAAVSITGAYTFEWREVCDDAGVWARPAAGPGQPQMFMYWRAARPGAPDLKAAWLLGTEPCQESVGVVATGALAQDTMACVTPATTSEGYPICCDLPLPGRYA